MYTDGDIDSAVRAGIMPPATASAFRDFVAGQRHAPLVDEEHFRLITGFNDIFVTIAAVLLLVAVAWIGNAVPVPRIPEGPNALSPALVAATAWGLAEYFTRRRRMALPSILLLLAFSIGTFLALAFAIGTLLPMPAEGADRTVALVGAFAAALTAFATWLHWRRFHVPITVAAGTLAGVALAIALLLAAMPIAGGALYAVLLMAGLAVFAFAMHWDMSDPTRTTRRADVAFWLHLLAAPLIVHPIFALLGLLDGGASIGEAGVVIALYVAMGLVAIAVDRRALLVSALAYVLYALSTLFREFGAVSLNIALTALVIGSALLLLSAFWSAVRNSVLEVVPPTLRQRLPHGNRPADTASA
ncbi:hypothetical protein SAMN06295912_101167 [Sphingomonas laterariae]|uniref:Uncharacterized protein n=1 Tax=Edaphosphingomonas laterariae TaxID=861865 RepID=A0A239BHM7_9SPHN|nr:hypothetical protein [Sphingomonas laterariae]SNS07306.1 hypothetical protein SAMN06295912_101167 [Sphingomonas laterariae]